MVQSAMQQNGLLKFICVFVVEENTRELEHDN